MSVAILIGLAAVGCSKSASAPKEKQVDANRVAAGAQDPEVAAALATLSEEDRQTAQAQRFCAAEPKNLLGSMGEPFKLMIEGQAVFLCCEGCKEKALENPQATLAKAAQLKQNTPQ